MKGKWTSFLVWPILIIQALLALRVIWRMIRSAGGERISVNEAQMGGDESVTVILPVLNEYDRLSPCLEGLIGQGTEVTEILVVDGGSDDGTQTLVSTYARRDSRIQLIDASPIPANWNGKAWGLQKGLCSANACSNWILTIDADVRPGKLLTRALLGRAKRAELSALSVATLQKIDGPGLGLIHPSLLTTLVYRFGLPGKVIHEISQVQANGQCFMLRKHVLEGCGGFQCARNSVCEDISIARSLVMAGHPVGFYEAGDLVTVNMYRDWRDAWHNWTRSLPMHDQFSGINTFFGWLEILLVQALPLPLFISLILVPSQPRWLFTFNGILLAIRIGVLFGTTRAYHHRPWSYWLSPLCDLPVAIQLGRSALQRRHVWRGRVLVRGGSQ